MGANIETLKKDNEKFSNRLLRNDGNGVFSDVTKEAGLAGTGYDMGVAVGDYDNDGYADIFVAGVHGNTLYHNNGNGTFADVTAKAGLDRWKDPKYGPLWATTAAWVDVNNDGLLDLFVVNYLQWDVRTEHLCGPSTAYDYCSPKFYEWQPNQFFLNRGDGTFEDVSEKWGIRNLVGKGMGVGVADYELDGRADLFLTDDTSHNFLLHNTGNKFEEIAFAQGVALVQDGEFVSGMGLDFRDYDNDGYPDIVFAGLNNQTFPIFRNKAGKGFEEVTYPSGMRQLSRPVAGYDAGFYDFDNDGWKDLFITRGHVERIGKQGMDIEQYNTVFRNLGTSGRWQALTSEAGLESGVAQHRGCAFGDLDGDGGMDVVVPALDKDAEIWLDQTEDAGQWLQVALEETKSNRDGIGAVVQVVTVAGAQNHHMTTSVGYASSSHGPVHFGLGKETKAKLVEIRWPSGIVQTLQGVAGDRQISVKEAEAK